MNGSLITLLTVLKGLPLTYGKDMQEDKEPVFDAAENLLIALAATTGMMRDLEFRPEAMRSALDAGFPTATDLADWMVQASNCLSAKRITPPARSLPLPNRKVSGLNSLALKTCNQFIPTSPQKHLPFLMSIMLLPRAGAMAVLRLTMSARPLPPCAKTWIGNKLIFNPYLPRINLC